MKKIFAMILAISVLSVFVAGCSGGDAAASPEAPKTEGEKKPAEGE